jgi:hypothetical protein
MKLYSIFILFNFILFNFIKFTLELIRHNWLNNNHSADTDSEKVYNNNKIDEYSKFFIIEDKSHFINFIKIVNMKDFFIGKLRVGYIILFL